MDRRYFRYYQLRPFCGYDGTIPLYPHNQRKKEYKHPSCQNSHIFPRLIKSPYIRRKGYALYGIHTQGSRKEIKGVEVGENINSF